LLQFCHDALHQLAGDIEVELLVQFADAGGAGDVDLGEVVADDDESYKH